MAYARVKLHDAKSRPRQSLAASNLAAGAVSMGLTADEVAAAGTTGGDVFAACARESLGVAGVVQTTPDIDPRLESVAATNESHVIEGEGAAHPPKRTSLIVVGEKMCWNRSTKCCGTCEITLWVPSASCGLSM